MPQRPNILILYTDQQRWDALGCNGNRDIQTPNLDRLAATGVNFSHHFVQNPVCMPSRISFLSGQYPSTLGITDMGVPVPATTTTLPRLLRNYGYRSANIGKLHFLPHANRDHRLTHPDYGFDHLEIADEPGCYEDAYRAWVRRHAPECLPHLSLGLPPATAQFHRTMNIRDGIEHPERAPFSPHAFGGPATATHTAFVADRTIDYLAGRDRQPFLCIAGFYNPHPPLVAPQAYLDLYDPAALALPELPPELNAARSARGLDDATLRAARQGYYAMVSEVDHHVGRILQALDDSGQADNTIVVFTSDHGEYLGQHARWGKGAPGHECVQRVPLIIRFPDGATAPGRTCSGLVEAVDVLPTLLDGCGIPVPPHLQGRSLWPVLHDQAPINRTSALMEGTGWRTIRTAHHRYVLHSDGREHLWDLRRPCGEYHDLAGLPDQVGTLAEMRLELARRLIAMERPRVPAWPY